MRLNDPAVLAEVTAAFQIHEQALDDNTWARGHARPNMDRRRTLANTVITTSGDDFAAANTESTKRDTGRRGRQSQTWMRTEAGWRVVSPHASFFPAQD